MVGSFGFVVMTFRFVVMSFVFIMIVCDGLVLLQEPRTNNPMTPIKISFFINVVFLLSFTVFVRYKDRVTQMQLACIYVITQKQSREGPEVRRYEVFSYRAGIHDRCSNF